MNDDPFHQTLAVKIEFKRPYQAGELNRVFKELGATLYYDVYGFDRNETGPIWQSECYADLTLFLEGKEVDAQDNSDSLEIQYPLATISAEYISIYAELVEKLAMKFDAVPELCGDQVNRQMIIEHCDRLTTDLLQTWGEEPGSKNLCILIETNQE